MQVMSVNGGIFALIYIIIIFFVVVVGLGLLFVLMYNAILALRKYLRS
jgi:hypothetical protein